MDNPMQTHGAFSWMELHSGSAEAAKDFYGALLGWESESMPMGDQTYLVITNKGDKLGGFPTMAEETARWIPYVTVDDVDTRTEKAKALGCNIMAEIGAQAAYGIDMKYVLMAPIYAIPKVIEKEGCTLDDIDLFEINEAFSGSSQGINNVLGLDPDKVNVNGGSVALGHPIGASGARVLTTLLYEMEKRNLKKGLASLCLGGGEAVALVVNRPA